MLYILCHDMVVFCRDRNFLLQLFNFVAIVSAMLRHSFLCCDRVSPTSMDLLSRHNFFFVGQSCVALYC